MGVGATVMDPAFVAAALKRSSLARELRAVFHGLITSGAVHVRLNSWVLLSTSLVDAWAQRYASNCRPYHTMLLLRSTAETLAELPSDASPQLVQLIRLANPLRSFQEIQVLA